MLEIFGAFYILISFLCSLFWERFYLDLLGMRWSQSTCIQRALVDCIAYDRVSRSCYTFAYARAVNISCYYMSSSVSGQDEPNRALWLATWAGKMEPSCPLGTTRSIPQATFHQKPYNKSFIDQVCSVKMAGYWPRSFFCEFMDLDFVSIHKHAKKELGQYPAILTSHLVNNPYVLPSHFCGLWLVLMLKLTSLH